MLSPATNRASQSQVGKISDDYQVVGYCHGGNAGLRIMRGISHAMMGFIPWWGGEKRMTRRQRLRGCGNLLQMLETTQSPSTREMYRRQYRQLASRLQNAKQLHAV